MQAFFGAQDETSRQPQHAFLLSLAPTAILVLVFLLLVWTPAPPPPEATGYLLLELDQGAPVTGEEQAPVPETPAPEAPPAPPVAPREEPKPAAEEVPPEPPQEEPQPPVEVPLPEPLAEAEPAPPTEAEPAEPVEPAAPPAPQEAPAVPEPAPQAAEVPLPQPELATQAKPAPQAAPAPQVAEAPPALQPEPVAEPPAPQTEPLAPGETPLEAPSQTAPPGPAAPVTMQTPATPVPTTVPAAPPTPIPTTPALVASPTPAPVGPAPIAPAPPAPPPPAPAAPAPAPAPPAAQPLAGGEEVPAPPAPAASPQAGPTQGGAVGPGEEPYKLERLRPVLAFIDNSAAAWPQWGLEWAVQVHEVPVEGGVTRLLVRFEGGEKGKIGPVRSARPYALRLAEAMGAVALHVGGSPEALAMIEREGLVTFDGLYDPLFQRDPGRRPPHNTYVEGPDLRKQLHRLRLDHKRVLQGKAYRPPPGAPPGERVEVRYAPDYVSAFRYNGQGYRWYRNGRLAREAPPVTAVVVLRVEARVIDDVGRLALDLGKGHGALYIEGRRVPVIWRMGEGLQLEDEHGRPIDLTPYRTWFLWVPPWATLR
ncbi:DUF3048 domain-containing protein [Oceanithermus sp.]